MAFNFSNFKKTAKLDNQSHTESIANRVISTQYKDGIISNLANDKTALAEVTALLKAPLFNVLSPEGKTTSMNTMVNIFFPAKSSDSPFQKISYTGAKPTLGTNKVVIDNTLSHQFSDEFVQIINGTTYVVFEHFGVLSGVDTLMAIFTNENLFALSLYRNPDYHIIDFHTQQPGLFMGNGNVRLQDLHPTLKAGVGTTFMKNDGSCMFQYIIKDNLDLLTTALNAKNINNKLAFNMGVRLYYKYNLNEAENRESEIQNLSGDARKAYILSTGDVNNKLKLFEIEALPVGIYKAQSKSELRKIIENCVRIYKSKVSLNWIDTSAITDMSGLFKDLIFRGDISKWNVSNVTDMSHMFEHMVKGKNNLEIELDLSKWDVSNVTNMSYMFANNSNEKRLNWCTEYPLSNVMHWNYHIENWDVSNVKDMSYMFYNAGIGTRDLNLSKWDMSNVKNLSHAFHIDIRRYAPIYRGINQRTINRIILNSHLSLPNVKDLSFAFCNIKNCDDIVNFNITWYRCNTIENCMFLPTNVYRFEYGQNQWGHDELKKIAIRYDSPRLPDAIRRDINFMKNLFKDVHWGGYTIGWQ